MTDLDSVWRASQRTLGYRDGMKGKTASYADQHYQRGFREGVKRRQRADCQFPRTLSWGRWGRWRSCRYAASKIARDSERYADQTRQVGVAWAVCGTHANVLRRRGFVISEME